MYVRTLCIEITANCNYSFYNSFTFSYVYCNNLQHPISDIYYKKDINPVIPDVLKTNEILGGAPGAPPMKTKKDCI